jgi:hypothetical protein
VPGARKTEISGVAGGELRVRVAAPPVEGKANKELVSFLAKRLGVSRSFLTIERGETARVKVVLVDPGVEVDVSLLLT